MKKQVKAPKSSRSFPIEIDDEMLANIKRTALILGRPWRDVLNEVANQCFRKAWAGLQSIQVQLQPEEGLLVKPSAEHKAMLKWLEDKCALPQEYVIEHAMQALLGSILEPGKFGPEPFDVSDDHLLRGVMANYIVRKGGAR